MDETTTRQQQQTFYKEAMFTKLGQTGVLIQNGTISREEYNRVLSGKEGIKKFNEMRRSDGTVRAAIMAVMLPILGANWRIQPGGDSPADMLAAQIVDHSLFGVLSFDDFARQALTFLPFGFSLFEQIFEIGKIDGRDYVVLKDMGFRKQTSLMAWEMSDGMPGIKQQLATGKIVDIPDIKLTRFTFEQEGDNYEGTSLLRAAYKHWYMKTELELIDGMAHEKQGLGILKVRTPATAKEEDKEEARDIAKEQRGNESNYIEEQEGYSFEFMDMKAQTTKDITPSMQYHNRQILQSVLAQFLDIGSAGSSGSFSASDNQIDIFFMAEEAIAKEFREPINQTVIKNLIDLNGIKVTDYPTLEYGRIGSDAINVFSEALNKLFTSGVITPDQDIEAYIREYLHLPAMSDDMVKNYDAIRTSRRTPVAQPGTTPPATPTNANEGGELIKQARIMRDRLRSFASGHSNT